MTELIIISQQNFANPLQFAANIPQQSKPFLYNKTLTSIL